MGTFNKLKAAIIAKKLDPIIFDETKFNKQFPTPTKQAVRELTKYVDQFNPGPECWPPRPTVTIGSEKIALRGKIAEIVSEQLEGN